MAPDTAIPGNAPGPCLPSAEGSARGGLAETMGKAAESRRPAALDSRTDSLGESCAAGTRERPNVTVLPGGRKG
jgi:hypothetical protein